MSLKQAVAGRYYNPLTGKGLVSTTFARSTHADADTVSGTEFIGGLLSLNNAAAGNTLVFPTAAQIVAAITGPQVGDYFCVTLCTEDTTNPNKISVVTPSAGNTAIGSVQVGAGASATWQVVLDNVSSGTEATTMTRIA